MIFVKNVLPESYRKDFIDLIESIPMYWHGGTVNYPEEGGESTGVIPKKYFPVKDSPQFTHLFYDRGQQRSDLFPIVRPFLYFMEDRTKISVNHMHRIKMNIMTREIEYPDGTCNGIHVDYPSKSVNHNRPVYVFLYFPEKTDGSTFIFNEREKDTHTNVTLRKIVEPEENCGIIFRADRWHASSPPRKHDRRIAMNFVFDTTSPIKEI